MFILVYLLLVLTFGFTLLTTDIAIGRRTKKNAWNAFGSIRPKWDFLGKLTFLVPALIISYYSVIGGWVTRYIAAHLTGQGRAAAQDGYFTNFISAPIAPVVFMLLFLAVTAFVVYAGVGKGIERFSKMVMPGLLVMIIGIAVFSLTLKHTDETRAIRTGMEGLAVYLIPDFTGLTVSKFLKILLDAMSQLFFSLSVSMGIMITYGSYVKTEEIVFLYDSLCSAGYYGSPVFTVNRIVEITAFCNMANNESPPRRKMRWGGLFSIGKGRNPSS